jgi:kumamolisin
MERTLKSAAAAGISVVASTGDTGSTGCTEAGNSAALPVQSVQYPSSSPWVTAVGGTNISLNAANKITEEIVWNNSPTPFGASTGGYSLLFGKPSWQTGPGVGSGNLVRSTPDIALLADSIPGYPIYCAASDCFGGWRNTGGTSAATPLFASAVLIANQQAKAAGQAQLGFLNRTIYKLAAKSSTRTKVFRDVTKVGNDLGKLIGPSFTATGCCAATKYYDRASGWGSVNFPSFSYEARKLGGSAATGVTAQR